MENYGVDLSSAFHALSDPTRRSVLSALVRGPAPVKKLAEPFDMGLPSFIKHLKVLEEAGLIRTRKDGRVRTCHVCMERFTATLSWLAEQRAVWEERTDRLKNYVENHMDWSEEDDK